MPCIIRIIPENFLSGVFPHEAAGAIYIDTENKLPHGLAWIRLE
jgi:hypothetical protein